MTKLLQFCSVTDWQQGCTTNVQSWSTIKDTHDVCKPLLSLMLPRVRTSRKKGGLPAYTLHAKELHAYYVPHDPLAAAAYTLAVGCSPLERPLARTLADHR